MKNLIEKMRAEILYAHLNSRPEMNYGYAEARVALVSVIRFIEETYPSNSDERLVAKELRKQLD